MSEGKLKTILDRHPKAWYYLLLGCAVCLAFAGINAALIATGREGVWTQDAQPLYANFLIWSIQTIADAASSIASGSMPALPQFTYSMGYGADVPVTMGSYLQDPINVIVALMPLELIGVSYPLMTLARMVLASFTFSSYCFSRGHGRIATGVASLAYVTCGFIVLLGAFRHPKFIDWAILLPLILQGADRLFDGKRPTLLIASLFAQFCISIYFSYMSCIVLLVYCLVKYFALPRARSVADFASLVVKFALCGILAFLLSGLFSLPQIIGLLSQGRATSGGTVVATFFTLKYYAKVAAHFIGAAGSTDGMLLGPVSTMGLLVFLLCGKRFDDPRRRAWLIGFALCFAGVLIPFLGHVMNGMGYATDRWMLVLGFTCAYILCLSLPKLPELNKAEWKRLAIAVAVVAALTAAYAIAQIAMAEGASGMVWPLCMAAFFVIAFALVKALQRRPQLLRTGLCCSLLILLGAALAGSFYLSPLGQNWITTFPKKGTTWENISEQSPAAAMEHYGEEGLARYSLPRVYNSMKNSPLAHGLMGVDYYTSYYNQAVDDFRQDLGISDHHMNFSFVGSDSRLAIEDLTGVKYYICKSRDFWRVPYGFEDAGVEYENYHVFVNSHPVPLAYIAPAIIPLDGYEDLTMTQKQEALLQGAVVDAAELSGEVSASAPVFSSKELPFELVDSDGAELESGVVHAAKDGATLTIAFAGLAQSETYFSFENLSYAGYPPSTLARLKGKGVSPLDTVKDALWTESTAYPIVASIGKRTNTSKPVTPHHLRYGGKKDWVFNLGYFEKAQREMTLTFKTAGDYRFDAMKVVCQPIEPIVEDAEALADRALDGLELYTNGMKATARLSDDEPHVAVFAFAYTPGWSVRVDGAPAKALKTDTAFLGVELRGEGTHEIVWEYMTPGVKEGLVMSAIGLFATILLVVFALVRSRSRKR